MRQWVIRALDWQVRRQGAQAVERLPVDARILVVQPDHLGGMLASTPAMRLIKETLPTAEVTVLAGPWGADAAEHCPAVDRVRLCRFPAFERASTSVGPLGRAVARVAPFVRLRETALELRRERFDAALILVADYWSAAAAALANIPRRIGFSGGGCERFLTDSLDVTAPPIGKVPSPDEPEHVAAAQLRLARRLIDLTDRTPPPDFDSRMAYEPTSADRSDEIRLWRKYDLDAARGVVAIHPAPGGPAKRWPAERFAIVADHVSGRLGGTVVLTGGPGDVDEVRSIAARCVRKPVDLAGQTSFGALASLLERTRLVVGTDNGALHLATARGVPTLRLFGPTDSRVWSGWNGASDAVSHNTPTRPLASPRVCSPCHRLDVPDWRSVPGAQGTVYPCMDDLTVESVIADVERLWRETDAH